MTGQETPLSEPPVPAEGFVVTGTRTPVARATLPTPVAILTGAQLRESGVRTVAEAIRTLPGVSVVASGSAGAATSLFIRGGENDYVRILVDGIPINEAGGAIDLADLSTDQVERIEVLRGPGSVLYGSDAASGVIQIFTRRGAGPARLEVEAGGGIGERRHGSGRYGLSDLRATLSGATGPLSWSAGAGRSTTAGAYPMNNARSLHTANARIAWDATANTSLRAATRFSESESGYPTDGTGALVDENQRFDRRHGTTSLEAVHVVSDRLTARALVGLGSRRHVDRNEPDSPDDLSSSTFAAEHLRRTVELQADLALPAGTWTAGAAWERLSGGTVYRSDGPFGPFDASADYARTNRALFLQGLVEPVRALHLTLGGRIDDNEAFGRFDTYRIGVAAEPWEGGRIRGALGRSFREPTFGENYGGGFGDRGNEALVPERIRSREAGVEQALGGIRVALTWFDQRFRDLIQYTGTPPEPEAPNYWNVGAAEARGLEVEGEGSLGPVGLHATYTRLRTRVLDPGLATDVTFVEGTPLLRRPRDSGSFSARIALEGGSAGVTLHAVGAREDVRYHADFTSSRVRLPGYATLDLFGRMPLPGLPGAEVHLRIENALDRNYEGIAGFPAPGRIVRLGVAFGVGGEG